MCIKEVIMSNKHSSGQGGHEAALTVKSFYAELEKSAPKLYKKLTTASASATHDPIFTSDGFFDALHKEAPKLFEKVKASGFKFKLDSETENTWLHNLEEGKKAAKRLEKVCHDLTD